MKKFTSIKEWCVDNNRNDILDNIIANNIGFDQDNTSKSSKEIVNVKCDECNIELKRSVCSLIQSKYIKCAKCRNMKIHFQDLTGQKFNHLTAIKVDAEKTKNGTGTFWLCECDCGNPKLKSVHMSHLKNGETTSCGCVHDKPKERNPNWKGGKTRETQCARSTSKYKQWCKDVYKKDWYTCQCCGESKNIVKNAHHIINFSDNENHRYEISNGITLCKECHYTTVKGSFHNTYGTHNNTPEQLEEYINNKRKQLGIDIPFNIEEYQNGKILKPNDINNINNIDDIDRYIDTRKMKKISELVMMKPISVINQMN